MPIRLVMMGTGLFAEPTFEAILQSEHPVVGLVTQPDRVVGQERGSTRQTGKGMKNLALEQGIPVLQPDSINTPEAIAELKALQPELLVVAAYGQILAREVLEAAPKGGINVHASLLPKYRGAAPIAWAIYHGEQETGVSIIRMSLSLDAGDILAQESTPIGPEETTGEVEARLAPLGAQMAMRVIDQMEQGTVSGAKQDPSLVTRAPKIKKEQGAIRWEDSAEQVCNHVRAMQPWPTAFTFWQREGQTPIRLIVCRAHRHEGTSDLASGSILTGGAGAGQMLVAAGNSTVVEIVELQPAGKRRMAAADFLRGRPPRSGDSLGPQTS